MRRRSRELSTQMAAKTLKHERAKEFHFLNLTVRKLEASSLTTVECWLFR